MKFETVDKNRGGGISIIVPVYNGEKYIRNCLDTLLNQEGKNFEVIVINDGSTDRTGEIVKSIRDEKLVYFEQENKGVSAARNKGMELSRGEWIVFCDADDEVKQGYIRDINETVNNFPEYDVFCYAKSYVKGEGNSNDLYDITGKTAILSTIGKNKSIFKYCNDYFMCLTVWSKVYSKNFLIRNNLKFNTKVTYGEDILFLFKLFSLSDKIKAIHRGYYKYNSDNENSTISTGGKIAEKDGYISFYKELYEFIISRDDIKFWKDKVLVRGMNNFIVSHANCCLSRVFLAMRRAEKSMNEILKALEEMQQAHTVFRQFIGKQSVFSVYSFKMFLADKIPRLYVRLLDIRWQN